ncbi:MAG: hypothetical protein EXR63_04390 [Dehalococcoidia bacterium]|nr:hypothetical protein [Dehalococcoidia bacterium]
MNRPAFYARTGTATGDLLAILHPPYTLWHLSYVCIGAGLATAIDWVRLAGTLAAFLLGTGVAAHALDEWHSRPLRTALSDRVLLALASAALLGASGIGVAGAFVISPWLLAWAAAGTLLAIAYALEWRRWLHTEPGFAFAWGAFPVLAAFWAQAETLSLAALAVALAAALLSGAQRALSTPARFVRRETARAVASFEGAPGDSAWDRERLLATWERPLKLLTAALVALAAGMLLRHA